MCKTPLNRLKSIFFFLQKRPLKGSSTQPGSKCHRILASGEKNSSGFAINFAGKKPERSRSTFSYPKAWSAFWCCQDLQWWIICDLSRQPISVLHRGCSNPKVSPCSSHCFSSTLGTRTSKRHVLQETGERPANMKKGSYREERNKSFSHL